MKFHQGSVATGLSEIIFSSYGVDLYDSAIKLVLGEQLVLPSMKCSRTSSILTLRSNENGVFKGLEKVNDDIDVEIKVKPGDKVRKFRNGPDILGMLLTSSENKAHEELDKFLEEVHSNINIVLE